MYLYILVMRFETHACVSTYTYLSKEFDVFSEASVLLLEAAQNFISQLTNMLLQWIAAVQTLPEAKSRVC